MRNSQISALLVLASWTFCVAEAADLSWDGGTTNIATNGDGLSTYTSGTWSAAISNWDTGSGNTHAAWTNGDSAVFGGTYATGGGNRIATIGTNVTVNQIRVMIGGAGSNSRYDIGASATQNDFAITFGGSYSDVFPAITGNAGTNGFINNNFNAKITGDLTSSGGLVVKHGSNITTPGSSGRFGFTNANNDFIGNVVVAGGNLAASSANGVFGNAANKIVLRGGSLFISGGAAVSAANVRNIEVATASGLSTNAASSGLQVLDLTGVITGSGNLTRYSATAGTATSEVRFSGDMSGYTGIYESTGSAATFTTVQTTATSGGTWKLSGSATLKLNTTDDTHIAHGAGKSDLLMNGGTLDLNGKSETINGLSGATGIVQNQLAATTSTFTLGAADATASFGGALRNNSGAGGTLALTKIGTGTQTLGGANTYSGPTAVNAGTLVIGGSLKNSPVSVATSSTLVIGTPLQSLTSLSLADGSILSLPLDGSGSNYLLIDNALTLNGGTVTIRPTFSGQPALGVSDLLVATGGVTGTATLTLNLSANGATRVSGTAQVNAGTLTANITSLGADLVWNNGAASGVWEINGDSNFLNGASADKFLQYDDVTFGPASPAGTITLEGALLPASVTVNSAGDFVFDGTGSIGGGALLEKDGSGKLTIATDNTATGGADVLAGTLAVDGSLGDGDVNVSPGATLAGSGSIDGDVFVDGTIAPGTGVATLTTGALSLGGTYACEISGAQSDKLVVAGTLDISGATLTVSELAPATAMNYVIATCTGSVVGTLASPPAGYVVDTTSPGKLILWKTLPDVGDAITFEVEQSYPIGSLATVNVGGSEVPFDGVNGWSRSTSSTAGGIVATGTSGEYFHGQGLGAGGNGTYIGGKRGMVEVTGTNTVSFDSQYASGISFGYLGDQDGDGLFDQVGASGECGMAFGVGGTPARFQARYASFGTEIFTPGNVAGVAGNWYHFDVTVGPSIGGNRAITMHVRDLTNAADLDLNGTDPGNDWSFSVTDAQFGVAPELAVGGWVRLTSPALIDNLRLSSVEPPVGTAYDTWMDSFPTLTGNDRLPDADPDHDGIANLLEFVLDGNPTASDTAILPASVIDGGNFKFSFKRRDDSEALTTLTFQYGGSVGPWTDVVIGNASGASAPVSWIVDELAGAPDIITVSVPVAGNPRMFARILVEEVP